jgi:hypothetical protein
MDSIDVVDGTATKLPVPDASIDVAWMQAVAISVPDKHAMAREIRRVSETAGALLFLTQPRLPAVIRTSRCLGGRPGREFPRPCGGTARLLMPDFDARMANVARNIGEGRLRLLQAVFRAV